MKLALHAWQMGRERDLDTMIGICAESGMVALELMEHETFRSAIPLDASAGERAEIRRKFQDAGVGIAALSINCRYDWMDAAKVRASIEESMRYVDLAVDVGAPRLRCLGDQLHEDEGEPKEVTIARVAEALREVCEYADPRGIDCPIEMHGKFSPWENALAVVEQADHPRCYLVHNGTEQNTPPDRWDEVWARIRPHVKHVHAHDVLSDRFPYKRFFLTLRDSGYDGLVCFELAPSDDPVRVCRLTRALVEEWLARGA
ncbi:MAG: sugar phosphate isomerase/epimerase [Candidatus Brocadiaceae bacterium]|nr:sugar phosphate isomerase/epimerase [Candidatus Brocadiaceae bacterium]